MYDECFPLIKVKISSRDLPFMLPLIKHLCNLRNKSMKRYGLLEGTMLQERINNLIRENHVREVYSEASKHRNGTKGCWNTINKITGRKTNNQILSHPSSNQKLIPFQNFQYLLELESLIFMSNCSCLTRNEPLQALINSPIGCGKTMLTSLHRLSLRSLTTHASVCSYT